MTWSWTHSFLSFHLGDLREIRNSNSVPLSTSFGSRMNLSDRATKCPRFPKKCFSSERADLIVGNFDTAGLALLAVRYRPTSRELAVPPLACKYSNSSRLVVEVPVVEYDDDDVVGVVVFEIFAGRQGMN